MSFVTDPDESVIWPVQRVNTASSFACPTATSATRLQIAVERGLPPLHLPVNRPTLRHPRASSPGMTEERWWLDT
ncbi:hypothetical protein CO666_19610 [Rhizobium chutanense]|uniref:Uncharacterized protein n=1 Tax=Rhizobium chutanense TaxID=2035448 RepID=A0A2A6J9F3_9HYPH|nr:hypothetical protein CO666_19610 [Rhizobium chutanense]